MSQPIDDSDEKSGSSSHSGSGSRAGSRSSSYLNRHEITNQVPMLFGLVQERKWRKLRKVLKDKKRGPDLCKQRDNSGLWLLGIALGYGAKLDIIQLIISVDPTQLYAVDNYGAHALHLACLNGASIEIVQFILEHNGSLVNQPDNDQRMALHHAIECLCRNEKELDEGFAIIQAMCTLDPTLVHCVDKLGDNPMDLVYLSLDGVGRQEEKYRRLRFIYEKIRHLSIEVYKIKKQAWEEIGYDTSYFPTGDENLLTTKKYGADDTIPTELIASDSSRGTE